MLGEERRLLIHCVCLQAADWTLGPCDHSSLTRAHVHHTSAATLLRVCHHDTQQVSHSRCDDCPLPHFQVTMGGTQRCDSFNYSDC